MPDDHQHRFYMDWRSSEFRRSCGEHRTVGDYRAWCHACWAWCYPDDPCHGCDRERIESLTADLAQARAQLDAVRALADALDRDAAQFDRDALRDDMEPGRRLKHGTAAGVRFAVNRLRSLDAVRA